jgi:hypothetical protein
MDSRGEEETERDSRERRRENREGKCLPCRQYYMQGRVDTCLLVYHKELTTTI